MVVINMEFDNLSNFKLALVCCYDGTSHREITRLIDSFLPYNDINGDRIIDEFILISGPYKFFTDNPDKYPQYELAYEDSEMEIAERRSLREIQCRFNNVAKFNHGDCHLVIDRMIGHTEFEKRNKYLEICDQLDIDCAIIVDSDEYLIYHPEYLSKPYPNNTLLAILKTRLQKLYQSNDRVKRNFAIDRFSQLPVKARNVYLIEHEMGNVTSTKPRVWFDPGEMTYAYGSHYHYYNQKLEQEILTYYNHQNIRYIQGHHGSIYNPIDNEPDITDKPLITLGHDHLLRDKSKTDLHADYMEYLEKYESLVQQGFDYNDAHIMANKISNRTIERILNH